MSDLPSAPWKPAGRAKTPAREPLSLDRIVDAALAIVDAEGTEAVTMRRVAGDLGTGAASLYAYVASREELLRLVHEKVISEMELPDLADLSWADALRAWARLGYAVYRAHGDISIMSFADIPTTPSSLHLAEVIMARMIDGGVPPKVAAWTLDRLALYIAADAYEGWIMQNRFGGATPEESEARGREYFAQVRSFMGSLPAERFPTITSHLGDLMEGDGQERFDFGIELFIAGIASHVRG